MVKGDSISNLYALTTSNGDVIFIANKEEYGYLSVEGYVDVNQVYDCNTSSFYDAALPYENIYTEDWLYNGVPVISYEARDLWLEYTQCEVGEDGIAVANLRLDSDDGLLIGSVVIDRERYTAQYTWQQNIEL